MDVCVQHAGGSDTVHLPSGSTVQDLYVALRPVLSKFVLYYIDKPVPVDRTELHWFLDSGYAFQARDASRHCIIPGFESRPARSWAFAAKCR
jgi:hypothetical protein